MNNKSIDVLVVDDEEIMRSLFTDLLSDQGHKVSVASNGKEAVELVKEKFFRIVLLDVHMPVMNGIQALTAIKTISPKTSIVMFESFFDVSAEKFLREEAVTCIHKPFNIQEIIDIVNEKINGEEVKE